MSENLANMKKQEMSGNFMITFAWTSVCFLSDNKVKRFYR